MIPTVSTTIRSIKVPGVEKPVLLNSIIRLQGESNYTWLHLQTHPKPILTTKNLKWFEEMIPGFVRVHKSDLINPSFVLKYDSYNSTTLEVSMPNKQIVKVSRRRIDSVLLQLKQHRNHLS
ncbi:LytR/AlgR family response regulator transcription factor [Spirosoma gilvum]